METAVSIAHTCRLLTPSMAVLRIKEGDLRSGVGPPEAAALLPAAAAGAAMAANSAAASARRGGPLGRAVGAVTGAVARLLGLEEPGGARRGWAPVGAAMALGSSDAVARSLAAARAAVLSGRLPPSGGPRAGAGGTGVAGGVGLVIDGGALALALQPDHERELLELCRSCAGVVCCRVSPMQKAQVRAGEAAAVALLWAAWLFGAGRWQYRSNTNPPRNKTPIYTSKQHPPPTAPKPTTKRNETKQNKTKQNKVARLLKRLAGAVTLAIGDGANDVSMIQAAHIGVGVAGREGRAAAQAADFACGQFRFLLRLLLVHGRQSYLRCREVVLYAFYKNAAYVSCFVFFAFYSGANGFWEGSGGLEWRGGTETSGGEGEGLRAAGGGGEGGALTTYYTNSIQIQTNANKFKRNQNSTPPPQNRLLRAVAVLPRLHRDVQRRVGGAADDRVRRL